MKDTKKWKERRKKRRYGCRDCRYYIRALDMCARGEENCILLSEDLAKERPPCRHCYWWDKKKDACTLDPENCGWLIGIRARQDAERLRARQRYEAEPSDCKDCPYRSTRPCVGVCMRQVVRDWKKVRAAVKKAGDAVK